MAGTVYLVLAMRRPDFNAAAVQPHLDFLDALRERGQLQLTVGAENVISRGKNPFSPRT